MTGMNPSPKSNPGYRLVLGCLAMALALAGLFYGVNRDCPAGVLETNFESDSQPAPLAQPLFTAWPKGVKPDGVVILSGQTFGMLQPCGCSRPQMGGLERRANFIATLREKGWPVVGVDLGDLYPPKGKVAEQSLLKYATAMTALREMGYIAIGLGKDELSHGIYDILASYTLQNPGKPPFVLAGNLTGPITNGKRLSREDAFPSAPGKPPMVKQPPMVLLTDSEQVGGVPIGVVGVVGASLARELAPPMGTPALIGFDKNDGPTGTIMQALNELAASPGKPALKILLYQGSEDEAKALATAQPEFSVIVCLASDPEPPQFPVAVPHKGGGKTLIVQVGDKGRYVGALGIFKKADGGFDLHYQLVPLGEEYITKHDPAAEKANPVLPLLEEYSAQVKARNFLARFPQIPHPNQIREPKANLSYAGSQSCMACHKLEHNAWVGSHHSGAMASLVEKAKRPGLRNFDGECVVCHTVGFEYKTGYRNETATPLLKNVGCESCHGPGSGHNAEPANKTFLAMLSPWKLNPTDKLPDAAMMAKMADTPLIDRGKVAIPPAQMAAFNKVERTCMKCHDAENDPHFDLWKYWPKISHTGLKPGAGIQIPVVPVPGAKP